MVSEALAHSSRAIAQTFSGGELGWDMCGRDAAAGAMSCVLELCMDYGIR